MGQNISDELKEEILKLYPGYSVLKEHPQSKDGRYRVSLSGEKIKTICSQRGRLLLEVSLGRRLINDETVDHVNNDKTDDSKANLQVLSRSENASKGAIGNKHALGYKQTQEHKRSGSKNGQAKLSDDAVKIMRQQYSQKALSKIEIMDKTGLCEKSVRNMLFGTTYVEVGYAVKPNKPGRPSTKK